jgi:hypothetical protein
VSGRGKGPPQVSEEPESVCGGGPQGALVGKTGRSRARTVKV